MTETFELPLHVKENFNAPNPMVRKCGKDKEGRKCKDCALLIKERYHCKTYYKCRMRGTSRGAGTDHRIKWDACKQFKVAPKREHSYEIAEDKSWIKCLECGKTSYSSGDVENLYCGHCHKFHK